MYALFCFGFFISYPPKKGKKKEKRKRIIRKEIGLFKVLHML